MPQVQVHGIATGGDGVARQADGRIVFVRGALPGDTVEIEVESEHKRFAHASVVEVVSPAPQRRDRPCRHGDEGCGGCGFQHASLELQRDLKTQIVTDCLQRIGRIDDPVVTFGGGVSPQGYRTTVRAGVTDGRAGFREHRAHTLVPTPDCLVAHPRVREIVAEGRFPEHTRVQVRVGANTGDCLTVVDPTVGDASVPSGQLVGNDQVDAGREAFICELVGGRQFRVSARSFFQSGPEAAELLVATVNSALGPALDGVLVDLYSGVGLFAASVAFEGRRVAVEQSPSASADASVNTSEVGAEMVRTSVEAWTPIAADVVIADPSRRGLGSQAAAVVAATGAAEVVLVSCDPGALGRDARLLLDSGYELLESTVLDLFPQTTHVEVVSHFTRSGRQNRAARS